MSRDARIASALWRTYRAVGVMRPDSAVTFADRFEAQVEQVALIQGDRTLRYHELDAEANRFASWAQSIGVARGDVVALLIGNRPELPIAQIGLAKLGAVSALINLGYGEIQASAAVSAAMRSSGDKATAETLIRASLKELAR